MMQLDLTALLKHETDRINFEFDFESPDIGYEDDRVCFDTLVMSGNVQRLGDQLFLTTFIHGWSTAFCARCRQTARCEVHVERMEEMLPAHSSKETEMDKDIFYYEGRQMDLEAYANELLVLQLPAKTLCQDQCSGICTECGCVIDAGACECQTDSKKDEATDPRLAPLQKWLEKHQ